MIASSSAITTRVGSGTGALRGCGCSVGRELVCHPVEESVLLALELRDRARERVPVAGERVGMAAGVACLDVAERRLSHEGTQAGVVGLVLEERDLLV